MHESEPQPIGKLLGHVSHLHRQRLHNVFEGLGLHRGQSHVLRALWHNEGQTHSELAAHRCVQPSTISRMLQRMEKDGFIIRRPDPDDQRISRVYLTDHGRAVQDEIHRTLHAIEMETMAEFTPAEQALLRRFLMQMRDNLQSTADDACGP